MVREEAVLSGGTGDLVYFSRGEGEKVSKGGTVALVYQSAQALQDANTLRSLEEQLEQLTYARTLAAGSSTTARLDEEVVPSLSPPPRDRVPPASPRRNRASSPAWWTAMRPSLPRRAWRP